MFPPSSSSRESSGTSSHIVPPSARKYSSLNSADLYQAGKDLGSQEEITVLRVWSFQERKDSGV